MEYFGSRLVWNAVEEVIDPDMGDVVNNEEPIPNEPNLNNEEPSTSGANSNLPNEIQYAD